jgi:hypothetical protein
MHVTVPAMMLLFFKSCSLAAMQRFTSVSEMTDALGREVCFLN